MSSAPPETSRYGFSNAPLGSPQASSLAHLRRAPPAESGPALVPHMVELLLLRALEDRLALLRLAECGTGGPQRKVAIGHALRFTLHRRQARLHFEQDAAG